MVDSHVAESHDTEIDKPQYEDINTPVVFLVGVISAIITFLLIAFIEGLCYQMEATFHEKRINVANQAINRIVEQQKSNLTATADEGRISIEEAMDRVVQRYSQKTASDSNGDN